jgi:hypothetical protein
MAIERHCNRSEGKRQTAKLDSASHSSALKLLQGMANGLKPDHGDLPLGRRANCDDPTSGPQPVMIQSRYPLSAAHCSRQVLDHEVVGSLRICLHYELKTGFAEAQFGKRRDTKPPTI